jgi:hypothetical protein
MDESVEGNIDRRKKTFKTNNRSNNIVKKSLLTRLLWWISYSSSQIKQRKDGTELSIDGNSKNFWSQSSEGDEMISINNSQRNIKPTCKLLIIADVNFLRIVLKGIVPIIIITSKYNTKQSNTILK